MRHHAQGQEQIAEGLEMPGVDLRTLEVVKHVPAVLAGRLGPWARVSISMEPESVRRLRCNRGVWWDAIVQFHERRLH